MARTHLIASVHGPPMALDPHSCQRGRGVQTGDRMSIDTVEDAVFLPGPQEVDSVGSSSHSQETPVCLGEQLYKLNLPGHTALLASYQT